MQASPQVNRLPVQASPKATLPASYRWKASSPGTLPASHAHDCAWRGTCVLSFHACAWLSPCVFPCALAQVKSSQSRHSAFTFARMQTWDRSLLHKEVRCAGWATCPIVSCQHRACTCVGLQATDFCKCCTRKSHLTSLRPAVLVPPEHRNFLDARPCVTQGTLAWLPLFALVADAGPVRAVCHPGHAARGRIPGGFQGMGWG